MNSRNIVIGISVLALIGAFLVLKPKPQPQSQTESTQTEQTTQPVAETPAPAPNTFELVIKGRKIVSGPAVIQVKQGDEVTIKVTSDEAEEFHIHGYDKSLDLEPNVQGELKYKADVSGRFPFELEHSKTELGAIEVAPQ